MITKVELDELVLKYETSDFIKDDPIQFLHKFSSYKDIELAGFIASLFSYGNRKIFIKKLDELFSYSQGDLLGFVKAGDFESIYKNEFNYRFSKSSDVVEMLRILSKLYNESNGLEELFGYGYSEGGSVIPMLKIVVDYFYGNVGGSFGQGFYHLLPDPVKGGAMKRMNMFLRWMVRKSVVDIGIWDFIPKSELLIPLDVHVARLSREMGLLNRKSNDMRAVIELTNNLKQFDCDDPVKYDFAIFAKGIEEYKKF